MDEGETSAGSPATAFFSRTYDEAMALTVEARDYFAVAAAEKARGLGPATGLDYCRESVRLTTQLTQVMAWLLTRRAVHAGEMTVREARSETYALSGVEHCLEDEHAGGGILPAGLRSLLMRSTRLFRRVAQLDSMARRDTLH